MWFAQCTYLAAVGSVGVDCLFYGSAFNISSHFQIIQKKLQNMKFDEIIANGSHKGKTVVTEGFRNLVQYHQKVLEICDEFSKLYSAVLFTQFLVTSVQLCVIAFQLTLVSCNTVIRNFKEILNISFLAESANYDDCNFRIVSIGNLFPIVYVLPCGNSTYS